MEVPAERDDYVKPRVVDYGDLRELTAAVVMQMTPAPGSRPPQTSEGIEATLS